MAPSRTKSFYTCTILLLLLLLSDVAAFQAHGRRLLRRRHEACKGSCLVQGGQSTREDTGGRGAFAGLTADIARRKVLLVEDSQASRPTAPGHSPGVGHLLEGEAAPKGADSGSCTPSVDTQDARPTSLPGHNPGVDHLLRDRENGANNVDHTLSPDVQDSRPTTPGHSPGIGHSDASKSEGESVDVRFSSARGGTLNTEDLRPTEPGHSPGVGHSFDREQKAAELAG